MSPRITRLRFRMKVETIAVTTDANGKEDIIHLPADATIAVLDDLDETNEANRKVEVQWLGKTLQMFAADILARGKRI